MAKSSVIVLASALCFLSFLGSTCAKDRFFVEGVVYCDTCRVQFLTKMSEFLEGAAVRVMCSQVDNAKNVTFNKETTTNAIGAYKMEVDGDHEEDTCEVILVKSPRADCNEVDKEAHLQQAARISITKNNGIVSNIRQANPLGFLKKDRLPGCVELFKELGINEDGTPIPSV
ncbi:Pollen allergen Ole e 1 family [Vigna unguiculata]|uniref:Pollen allergen Ole e 1 family n=1 Tax=Vigna unguiculata TaxID=3917 RepID=A0A4D6KJY9_VIGUN|nr:Pollen allergen Ole e 1 family [Vigna unguiculata]